MKHKMSAIDVIAMLAAGAFIAWFLITTFSQ
jgi:hypothetical protein